MAGKPDLALAYHFLRRNLIDPEEIMSHPSPLSTLPCLFDQPTRTVIPPPGFAELDPARALSMSAAAALLRGRGGRHANVAVVRRWAGHKGWKVPLVDEKGRVETWVCRLPSARLGRELVTMPEWVAWFERMRVRLSRAPADVPGTRGRPASPANSPSAR